MKHIIRENSIAKRAICIAMALALLFSCVFSAVVFSFAQTITYNIPPTRLGNSDTFYSYNPDTKTLTISGTGDTPDFQNNSSSIPWCEWTSDTIEHVIVNKGVTKLGNYMFYQLHALDYSLPYGLRSIGKYCFAYNSSLTEIDIPYGVENIMQYAFQSDYYLKNISLPQSLKTIGLKAFYNCNTLEELLIPYSVTSIEANAFQKCSELRDLRFESLTQNVKIGNYAFQECASLQSIDIPLNATLGVRSYGYYNASSKYSDLLMRVFENSVGHNYAVGNNIPYEFITEIPLSIGVENYNSYDSSNIDAVYHYTFVPQSSGDYNFYSTGSCDLVGKLYDDGSLLAENDDIASDNRNFCVSYNLVQGEKYDLFVNTVRMEGDYSVLVYPASPILLDVLEGEIFADISDSRVVSGKRIFTFSDDRFSDFVFRIEFQNGFVKYAKYQKYIAGYYFATADNQAENPYVCGNDVAHISLNGAVAEYPISIEHFYEESTVNPTVDLNGYTLHTCAICGDSYSDNEVEPTSYIVTGNCILAEDRFDKHEYDVPYCHATIKIGNRSYRLNPDGTWQLRTFDNCYAVFENDYGMNKTVYIDVENNGSYNYGTIILDGYDLNGDGYVNAKDYAIYRKQKYEELGENYFRFASEFLIKHRLKP